jgi:hypothetical protein
MIGPHANARAGSDVWVTPAWVLNALGPFDLDPCAAPSPRFLATARTHVEPPADGLAATWYGRVWLNPPYSEVERWLARLAAHGRGTALVFARTDVAWFHTHGVRADALLFLRGRVTFLRGDGSRGPSNVGGPSVLLAYGADDAARLRASGLPGWCVSGQGAVSAASPSARRR